MKQVEHALIVGGGIAGRAAAIALAQAGVRVTMLEKQQEWRFQSSGIFIYHNGLAALGSLGVLPEIVSSGFAIADGRNIYLDERGEPITDTFYPSRHPDIAPIVGIRRAEMHRILASRLDALSVDIRLGTSAVRIDQRNGRARHRCTLRRHLGPIRSRGRGGRHSLGDPPPGRRPAGTGLYRTRRLAQRAQATEGPHRKDHDDGYRQAARHHADQR
ncbi:FAD-dependent oxidoreductase (plasmid) [Cupriavidus basilensis]